MSEAEMLSGNVQFEAAWNGGGNHGKKNKKKGGGTVGCLFVTEGMRENKNVWKILHSWQFLLKKNAGVFMVQVKCFDMPTQAK